MKKKGNKFFELFLVGLFSAVPAIYMALREDKTIKEEVKEAVEAYEANKQHSENEEEAN